MVRRMMVKAASEGVSALLKRQDFVAHSTIFECNPTQCLQDVSATQI
jgi:hypothetical protein